MDSQRYQRLKDLFEKAASAQSNASGDPQATLDALCGDDASLRHDLAILLRHRDAPAVDLEREAQLIDVALDDAWSPPRPHRIGEYHILDVLGEGGMAIVYLAQQERPKRHVALKVLRPGFATPRMLSRFEFEAEVLGRLKHPGIAAIYEAGVAKVESLGRVAYFAMEHVQGRPLREYVREANLPVSSRLSLMIDIARAVDYAHRQGVIHRDLKPANIVVDEISGEPVPKILDFGIARLLTSHHQATFATQPGEFMGTLPYMSPEQVVGEAAMIDPRADVYSLGVILFEMLANRLPIDVAARPIPDSVRNICEREPARLSSLGRMFRGDLDTIARKALEKDPERRYPSAAALADDIERFLANQPITARPATRMYQLRKFANRNRVLVGGLAAVMIAMIGGAVATTLKSREAESQFHRAEEQAQASRQISEFLHEILTSLDPLKATAARSTNRDITVREALDEAAPKIDSLGANAGPRVRGSLHRTIGLAYRAVGEHISAEAHLRRAHDLLDNLLGSAHRETLDAANELILVLVDLRRLDEAQVLSSTSLETARAQLPPQSETVARLLASAGIVSFWRGDHENAEQLQREHWQLMSQQHGPAHRQTLISMSNLGLTLSTRRKFDEASQLLSTCADLRSQTLGAGHAETLFARNNLANLLQSQGKIDEAAKIWGDIVERGRETLGPAHPEWHAWVRNLALSHALSGNVAQAVELLQDARPHLNINGADTHPSAIHSLGMLAMFLLQAEQVDDARLLIDQVHQLSVQVFGPDHPETIRSLTLYYNLYERLGDAEALARVSQQLKGTPFDPSAE